MFPVYVDMNYSSRSSCKFILSLDTIIELGIMINSKSKIIAWERNTISMKYININSTMSNELTMEKPHFAIVEKVT